MKKIVSALFAFALTACGTTPVTYSEGFSEEKNSAGVYTVRFTGNGHTTPEAVEKALDRRCAELTIKEGFDWFTYYTKSRNDHLAGHYSKSVPSYYGVIHLHKGTVGEDGLDAKKIVAEPLPEGISNK